jgi:putative transposase
MNLIHEVWTSTPFYGYRRITAELKRQGYPVNHKRIQRLMNLMNLQALYPKPNTSRAHHQHVKYPYLLHGMEITRPDQVWATDITYIPMERGFLYLVALIDLYSRYIVSWNLSISLEAEFCLAMLEDALDRSQPEILNSDQGCQFTSEAWTETLKKNGIQISMDGKGRCMDNIYIERFWRSLKQEDIYRNPPGTTPQARQNIRDYMEFYNYQRLHQSLEYRTPAEIYALSQKSVSRIQAGVIVDSAVSAGS